MNDINYYFNLLLKKIRIRLTILFEKKERIEEANSTIEDFLEFLWIGILNRLTRSGSGIYFKTKTTNEDKPILVAQARLISLICDCFESKLNFTSSAIVRKLTNNLISLKGENNLYSINVSKWDKQDEGIASVWASIALIKAYKITNNDEYRNEAQKTFLAIKKYLYKDNIGLVHTCGQNYWCINASSKLAYLCVLLKENGIELTEGVFENCIKLCIREQENNGAYPYTEKHKGIYILLYQASVIFYLNKCLMAKFLNEENIKKIQASIGAGMNYLKNTMTKDFKFEEPDKEKGNYYLISSVTSLAAISFYDKKEQTDLINDVIKFMKNDKLFLYKDKNNKLFNGRLNHLSDVYIVETLYWIIQYLVNNEYSLDHNSVS